MKKERSCQGYRIIDSQRIGGIEIVLGHSLTAPQPYVTWKAYEYSDFMDFYYGHYFDQHQKARVDFYARISEAWKDYQPPKRREQPQPKPPERGGRE